MNDNSGCGPIIFWLCVAIVTGVISAWFGMYVIESDLPTWLKYAILS